MPTRPIPEDIFEKAEQKLLRRSKGASNFSGCLSFILSLAGVAIFINWVSSNPQVGEWFSGMWAYLGTVVQPILDRLGQIPGGIPTPLVVVFILSVALSVLTGITKASSSYLDFKKYNRNKKAIEKEARRMIRSEGTGWDKLQTFLDEIQDAMSGMDDKAQRQFQKFRTWIDMWKEIPDEPAKAKRKAKRDDTAQSAAPQTQTVRLSDDGELIYDEETPAQASRSLNQ
jgi:hypothetical protein